MIAECAYLCLVMFRPPDFRPEKFCLDGVSPALARDECDNNGWSDGIRFISWAGSQVCPPMSQKERAEYLEVIFGADGEKDGKEK